MKHVLIHDPENRHWMQFTRPRAVLQAGTLSDVMPLLTEVQQLVGRDGLYAAGWIGYEAAPAFDSALRTRSATAFPFACFGIFGPPAILTALPAAGHLSGNPTWHPSVSRDEYGAAIARIKNHIAAGDTYQVNYLIWMMAIQKLRWSTPRIWKTCLGKPMEVQGCVCSFLKSINRQTWQRCWTSNRNHWFYFLDNYDMDGPSCETGGANGFMVETIRDRRKTGLPDSISKTFLRVSLIWFFGCARLSI